LRVNAAIAVGLLLAGLLAATAVGAQPVAPAPKAGVSRLIQLTPRVSTVLPADFAVVPRPVRNLTEVVRTQAGVQTAYLAITGEQRVDHEEALRRLAQIAGEAAVTPTFTVICGWPAMERIAPRRLAHPQADREGGADADAHADAPMPTVQAVTVAIAEGDSVVRFDGYLMPEGNPDAIADLVAFARAASCSANPVPGEARASVRRLREQQRVKPPAAIPIVAPVMVTLPPRTRAAPDGVTVPGGPSPAFGLGPGGAELQVAAANNGRNVVIGTNGGTSFSVDYADSFTASTVNVAFPNGDPTLGVGASGNFYLGGMSLQPTGCTVPVAVDVIGTGQTFNFAGNAASCPGTGAICQADQPQMAVDSRNRAAGGDQLYMAWRNFPGNGAATCNAIGSGIPTPTLACSSNSGQTWGNTTALTGGDRPRIAVGRDGSVYVTVVIGPFIVLDKYSSCANGLQRQKGFPLVVDSFHGVDCPMNGQFNNAGRCTPDSESSPQPAASPDLDGEVFVAYADQPSLNSAGADIIVRHSRDGGLTWPDKTRANAGPASRRFMPWICVANGRANVSWYDRRNANGSDDSLTNYFFSSVWFGTSPPSLVGGELDASQVADSQNKAVAGGDPKFGDYNGNACSGTRTLLAWASATPPPGIPAPGAGISVYTRSVPPGPPIVAGTVPPAGQCGGSTNITINGSNFYGVTGVQLEALDLVFGFTALTNVNVVNNRTITATVPASLRPGLYEVVVTGAGGSSGQASLPNRTDLFGIGPTVTGISPASGPVPGGTTVAIQGTCFDEPGLNQNNVHVFFGGKPAEKGFDQCSSSTGCTVISPAASATGPVDVVVNVDGAPSPPSSHARFTYTGPSIDHIVPAHGPKTGGTGVILFGDGFPPYQGVINNMQASFGPSITGASCLGSTQDATKECSAFTPAVPASGDVPVTAHAFGADSPPSPGAHFTYDEFAQLTEFQMPDRSFGIPAAVRLNGNAPPGGAVVQVTSSKPDVVRLAGPTVVIPAASTAVLVPLTILPTPTEQQATLTATYQGSSASGTVTVVASPPLSLDAPDMLDVNESATVTVQINTPAPAGGVRVQLTSSDASAIALPVGGGVTIPAGGYSQDFTITNAYRGKRKTVTLAASYQSAQASQAILVPASARCPPRQCPKGTFLDPDTCTCRRGLPQ
jgi:hypothetical protein